MGEVIDGGGTDFAPGDLVLTAPNIWSSRTFAGYQLIDPQFLLKLPRDVPEKHLLMAQQLGTVVFGCRRLPSLIGQTVVVVGQGSVGLFHDFMLRRLGAHRIIGIEPVPERLAAGRAMGLDEAIDVSGRRATEAVLDLTGGEGADLVIEAVGSVETLNQTLQARQAPRPHRRLWPAAHNGARPVRLGYFLPQAPGHAHRLRRPGRARASPRSR